MNNIENTNMQKLFKFYRYFAIVLILITQTTAYTQDNLQVINYEASYVSDLVNNFSGGIKQASAYMGMIDLSVMLNTEHAGLWKNGEFYIQVENTHGETPSANFIGDFQTFSNIENSDFTYLYQFFYHHKFDKLSFTIGVHDLNSEFLLSDLAGEYVNSSFGIMPSVSLNAPVSIFPKNALGFVTKFKATNNLTFLLGIYDGDPLDLDRDKYNMNFSLSTEEGFFSILETQISSSNKNGRNGTYKVGGFYHNGEFVNLSDSLTYQKGNYGFYLIADQMLLSFDSNNKEIGVFAKIGVAPKNRSMNNLFWALGLNYSAPFSKRTDDVLGIAVANAFISSEIVNMSNGSRDNSETSIEFMYKACLTKNISVQPEIQYIINPGADKSLENAFIGLLRTCITF